jgi:hypothetical protein
VEAGLTDLRTATTIAVSIDPNASIPHRACR